MARYTQEDFEAMLWNGGMTLESNPSFDAVIPHRRAHWRIRNLVKTDDGYRYELWFSRQSTSGSRTDVLLARVGRHVIKEWNSVEYIIYTVFDQSPSAFQKLDTLVKTGLALHKKWVEYEKAQRIRPNTLAFLSATHPRLGAQSPAAKLDRDLLVMIGKMCLQ